MNYRIRPGVVLAEVCGEYLLLATMEAGQHCPYVYQINETAAFFWNLLERGLEEDRMVSEIAAEYEAPDEVVRSDLRQFLESLQEKGYLLPKEECI